MTPSPVPGFLCTVALAALSACLSIELTACSSRAEPSAAVSPPAQAEVLQAQRMQVRKVEVTLEAPVVKILSDDTEGIPHQRFLIGLANGSTVLIAHDTRMAPRVPVNRGDMVRVHGEYIWNEKGGVIHWTHHTDTPRHEGGWIDFNGMRYE